MDIIKLAPLSNSVIFKKLFVNKEIVKEFVKDSLNIDIDPEIIETEKGFKDIVGYVDFRYDIFMEDKTKRVIVELQRVKYAYHYDRFLHYHIASILEQQKSYDTYKIEKTVYTIVVITAKTEEHKYEYIISDFTPQTLQGKKLPEIYQHKILYLNPYYTNNETPPALKDWLELVRESIENPENPHINRDREIINKSAEIIEETKITPQERAKAKDEAEWEEVKEKSYEEGEEKTKKEIAKNLLDVLDVETISKKTGLSKEEIEKLKEQIKQSLLS